MASVDVPAPRNLVELLCQRASRSPGDFVYTFLTDGETAELNCSFGDLARHSSAIGNELQKIGQPQARALLLFEPGLEFITAFFGCLYAGIVPVPVYPPDPMRLSRTLPRLQAIVNDSQAELVLTSATCQAWAAPAIAHTPLVKTLVVTDDITDERSPAWSPASITGNMLAVLQYTSGSTGSPRGVKVSHANLWHNMESIHRLIDIDDAVCVSWLPPYHDFGLIALAQSVFSGRRQILLSPLSFMQRPVRWLQAISRYRATTSGGPNFGYDLCARKVSAEDSQGLDLSSWTVAYLGAEPIRAETLDRFATAFAGHGFRRQTFYPGFGLAEATLAVSGGTKFRGAQIVRLNSEALRHGRAVDDSEGTRRVVGCGQSLADQELRIVDPESGVPCKPGEIGEIWVAGPSIAQGYWNNSESTQATFGARLAGSSAGPFLRTGDLGFLREGELFVTGRLKDLIIIAGRNHFPQDIEATVASCHPAAKPDGGAAFAIEVDGEERVAIVQEVVRPRKTNLQDVLQAIVRTVAEEHEVPLAAVWLIAPGGLPKTSSGKVQRRACRDKFLAREFPILAEWGAQPHNIAERMASSNERHESVRTETEQRLAALWSEVFDARDPSLDDGFFAMGGNSLQAVQLVTRINADFGVNLPQDEVFTASTIAELARRIDASPRNGAGAAMPIPRVARGTPQELSCPQRRLWFLQQLEPDNPYYNIAAAVELTGPFQAAAFEASLQDVIARHEVLRTSFDTVDGTPIAITNAELRAPFLQVDLRGISVAVADRELERCAHDESRRPFNLARCPLFHATACLVSPQRTVIILVIHHMIADGWSMGILAQELSSLYAARVAHSTVPLPELSVQYADFAAWQLQQCHNGALTDHLNYWKRQLAGAAHLSLPTDRPRPVAGSFRGGRQPLVLGRELTRQLVALGRGEACTPFTTLLAGFQLLLHRYTRQNDIVVGTVVAGRNRPEVAGLLGCFVNLLPLRTDHSGAPTVRELLRRVRLTVMDGLRHQDLPFEVLVDALQPDRLRNRAPLFQVLFVLQNAHAEVYAQPGWCVTEIHNDTVKYDLTLHLTEIGDHFEGWLGFNADLFEPETISQMARSFLTLLNDISQRPETPISATRLLSDSETQQAIDSSQGAVREVEAPCLLHELVERQCRRSPETIAVVSGDDRLTYGELDRRAEMVAHQLARHGVGPDVPVCIGAERSIEFVIAALAVLKSGGAFVPIDVTQPTGRLQALLDAVRPRVVLARQRFVPTLAESGVSVLAFEETQAATNGRRKERMPDVTQNLLAYMICTSGSTGRPKVVMVSHAAICNTLQSRQLEFPLDASDVVLALLSPVFDASVWDLFAPLAFGARLVLAPPELLPTDSRLLELIRSHGVTTLQLTPSVLRVVLEDPAISHCRTLQRIFCGGEPLISDLAQRLQARLPLELVNLYGPTEAAIDATSLRCPNRLEPGQVPLGGPIHNTRASILEANLRPTPPGVPGELCLSGNGLARGYWNEPRLTAERFVPDPFAQQPGARLYRTGDLCRRRFDGEIVFHGRIDQQVKLHGYRIELGDVESALREHTNILDAAVTVLTDDNGPSRLAACIVPRETAALDIGELRAALARQLPHYMLPAEFVVLDTLPRLPSGKVDRRGLPVQASRPCDSRPRTAPRTPLEEFLAGLFRELLGVETLGIEDSFFELGGDSIRAAILINRIQQRLGQYVYTVAAFDAPSIEKLARHLGENYADAVRLQFGVESLDGDEVRLTAPISGDDVAALRGIIRQLPTSVLSASRGAPPNPPAVFVLSPPRSGSTLTRVMLGGHPGLFAPPELQLLNFATLADRRAAFSTERDRFWLGGVVQAVMQARHCDLEAARREVEDCERRGVTTQQFYHRLQDWIGDRVFVDKTPMYALDLNTLRHAESAFAGAKFIHLIRHPAPVIASFEEARLHLFFPPFLTGPQRWTPRQLAELVWIISHQNILKFLEEVDAARQFVLRFEDLVCDPRGQMERLSAFLNIDFHQEMLQPHRDPEARMTQPIHPLGKMLGDVRFHEHKQIDRAAADRWRSQTAMPLCDLTRQLAAELGYREKRASAETQASAIPCKPLRRSTRGALPLPLVPIKPDGERTPLYCVHPAGGTIFCYRSLAQGLDRDQPVFGFEAQGLMPEKKVHVDVESMADCYVAALRRFQPQGPYFLGGWSLGGHIAYEMARQLTAAGDDVPVLALIDSTVIAEEQTLDEDYFSAMLSGLLHENRREWWPQAIRLSREEQIRYFKERAENSQLLPPGEERDRVRLIYRVFRYNLVAIHNYRPKRYPGPLHLFLSADRAEAEARATVNGWKELADGGVALHTLPGHHLNLLQPPSVNVLARRLQSVMDEALHATGSTHDVRDATELCTAATSASSAAGVSML